MDYHPSADTLARYEFKLNPEELARREEEEAQRRAKEEAEAAARQAEEDARRAEELAAKKAADAAAAAEADRLAKEEVAAQRRREQVFYDIEHGEFRPIRLYVRSRRVKRTSHTGLLCQEELRASLPPGVEVELTDQELEELREALHTEDPTQVSLLQHCRSAFVGASELCSLPNCFPSTARCGCVGDAAAGCVTS